MARGGGAKATAKSKAKLELWVELASTYSYLTAERIGKVAEAARLEVAWRPFLLGPLFAKQGWHDSPFNLHPAKGRYMWRDLERLCQGYGLPFQRPSVFPRHSLLAARVATLAEAEGWCEAWCRAVYRAEFARDRDIAEPAVLSDLLETLGQDPARVLDAAASPDVKARLRARTEEAEALGIFGAPTLRVDDELFWGNDRLGDAIAWAALGPAGRRS